MIALITPTGARPKQLELCTEFMRNQDYQGDVLWVVVDDAVPLTAKSIPNDFRDNWTVLRIYPQNKWKEGLNTQADNLLTGINILKYYIITAIFIIEDDDYYSPYYLSTMVEKLKGYDVVGQQCTVYYNPVYRGWMRNKNFDYASLFQVGFTPEVLPQFRQTCEGKKKFLDMNFFRVVRDKKVNMFNGRDLAIGIKGLPGRSGIGMGHRAEIKMTKDPEFEKLKELIGGDYKYYL